MVILLSILIIIGILTLAYFGRRVIFYVLNVFEVATRPWDEFTAWLTQKIKSPSDFFPDKLQVLSWISDFVWYLFKR
ncbi:hypothetical protein [Companilactobacillus ginsenosidimutans]|uniref:Uncharacterized protein n=1 Tax=Companilactobacillus ginsenosidimutans TaxID=1007676 RepID=A0A0H4R390_9LACO|nr:hypothetical protein [Companilactobacillus ginsenosidimutans]AKP68240.1 hypothetical protein ABM34_12300 [Companilactobacillus ginsenosidimutans]